MQKYLFIILVSALFSCKNQEEVKQVYTYFDSQEFVQNEIQEILNSKLTIFKNISLNGVEEIQKIQKVDSQFLYNEFKFLIDANINKPALYGKYETDTFSLNAKNSEGVEQIHYTYILKDSLNKKLKTKSLSSIQNLKTNEILGCLFHLESQNFMHAFSKDIYYEKNKGLRVDAWEKTLFQDTIYYSTNLILEKN